MIHIYINNNRNTLIPGGPFPWIYTPSSFFLECSMWAAKDAKQRWVTSKCTPTLYYKHSRTHLLFSVDTSHWCCPGLERICSPWLPRRSCFHLGSAAELNSYTHHPLRTPSLIALLHLNTHKSKNITLNMQFKTTSSKKS